MLAPRQPAEHDPPRWRAASARADAPEQTFSKRFGIRRPSQYIAKAARHTDECCISHDKANHAARSGASQEKRARRRMRHEDLAISADVRGDRVQYGNDPGRREDAHV